MPNRTLRLFGAYSAPLKKGYIIEMLFMRLHFITMSIGFIASLVQLYNTFLHNLDGATSATVFSLAIVLFIILIYMFRLRFPVYVFLLIVCTIGVFLQVLEILPLPANSLKMSLAAFCVSLGSAVSAWRVRHLQGPHEQDDVQDALLAFLENSKALELPDLISKTQTLIHQRNPRIPLDENQQPVPPTTIAFWALISTFSHAIVYDEHYDSNKVFTKTGESILNAYDEITKRALQHIILEKDHVDKMREAIFASIDEHLVNINKPGGKL